MKRKRGKIEKKNVNKEAEKALGLKEEEMEENGMK